MDGKLHEKIDFGYANLPVSSHKHNLKLEWRG